ncbi:unnamed protein product [Echinostoma caproni]|uniref:ANK_REP_REGION domain-containing protein n=1 Tax=Echinostoma caproni TaxID=27848 RepID=A0A183A6Q9_9TREM|nr:unnamed protein product [Echinostoma caproni]
MDELLQSCTEDFIKIFRLLVDLGSRTNDPEIRNQLLGRLAGMLTALLLPAQASRLWDIRRWQNPHSPCRSGVLATAIQSQNEYTVELLLKSGVVGIVVPHVSTD